MSENAIEAFALHGGEQVALAHVEIDPIQPSVEGREPRATFREVGRDDAPRRSGGRERRDARAGAQVEHRSGRAMRNQPQKLSGERIVPREDVLREHPGGFHARRRVGPVGDHQQISVAGVDRHEPKRRVNPVHSVGGRID